MFWNKPKSFLGVDLGAGGVKMVQLRLEKNRPVLFTYGYTSSAQDVHRLFARPEKTVDDLRGAGQGERVEQAIENPMTSEAQVDKYAGVIKAVCKTAKTQGNKAVVSLPVSAVFHAVVTLPVVKKEELLPMVQAEAKKLLPRPVEEMALDWQTLSVDSAAKTQKILINAVPRELVSFYTRVFQKSGLILDSLEPESTALARALVGRDQSVCMIIDMGAERTNFFIIDQGAPITHHSIESGGNKMTAILRNALGVEDAVAEKIKFDLSEFCLMPENKIFTADKLLSLFAPVIDPIVKEIGYSFDLYLRQTGNENKRPEKIILTGGAALLPYLAEHLANQFKIKCYIGDPWARVVYQDGLRPVLRAVAPRMAVAIGLALRNAV